MRFMILVRATALSEPQARPDDVDCEADMRQSHEMEGFTPGQDLGKRVDSGIGRAGR